MTDYTPASSADAGQLLTTREAARLCGVSEQTIRNWFDDRKLTGMVTAGGQRRIALESVHRLQQRSTAAEAKRRGSGRVDCPTLDPLEAFHVWLTQSDEWTSWRPTSVTAGSDLEYVIRNTSLLQSRLDDVRDLANEELSRREDLFVDGADAVGMPRSYGGVRPSRGER